MDLIEHRVRERAYFIWEAEGRVHGRAEAHWLRAEAEVAAPVARAGILTVQAVLPEPSLAPSPAQLLKPKTTRTRTAAAKPVTESAAKVATKTTAKTPAKAAKPAAKAAPKAPKAVRTSAAAAALH